MRKLLFRLLILVGIAYAIRTLMADEQRRQGLGQLPASMMERCMQMMPEDSPPKAMIAALSRIQEQSDQLLALLREQSDLLRQQIAAREPSVAE